MIVGASGTGKSTLIETLDSKETMVVNCLNKTLPFKGSSSSYSADNKNLVVLKSDNIEENYQKVLSAVNMVDSNMPHIKNLVIDDAGYLMNMSLFDKAKQTGYSKFTEIAYEMYTLLNLCKNLRDDLNIVFMFHQDTVYVDGIYPVHKIKVPGRMIEEKFAPNELATIVAFTKVKISEESNDDYRLVVNKTKEHTMAKSPRGMFDSKEIESNLKELINKSREYYA